MKVSIYGSGYVGLVTAACLAKLGHEVLCMDINPEKIALLQQGIIPIYEPGLSELILQNQKENKLQFTTDLEKTVAFAALQFICVSTPSGESGEANLTAVYQVAENIAKLMTDYKLIVNKSTVPVGTADQMITSGQHILKKRNVSLEFDVASNPEFLKEGSAIYDFLNPDRIILGVKNEKAKTYFEELYQYFASELCVYMDVVSAELTKYAANAMLATRISFINEIANLADACGADIDFVRKGIGMDPRIGPHFIAPGCGYGGSCFPKDVRALIHTENQHQLSADLLRSVDDVNEQQKHVLFHKLTHYFQNDLNNKTIALWGLAFKPNTDDIREATSRVLLADLWKHGAKVQAYDPVAMSEIAKIYPDHPQLVLCDSAMECLNNADVLVIVTEWNEFKNASLAEIKSYLKYPVVFDGRNIFSLKDAENAKINYFGIGRRWCDDASRYL